jgi:ATP-dependent RNA helicase DOB1
MVRKLIGTIRGLERKGISVYDPAEFVRTGRSEYDQHLSCRERLLNRRGTMGEIDSDAVSNFKMRRSLLGEVEALGHRIDALSRLVNQRDLDAMVGVLRQLEFVDGENVIQTKGRIAATITAADELVVTSLILSGALEPLCPGDCAALFSVFVSEAQGTEVTVPDSLDAAWAQLLHIAKNLATVSVDCGCDIDVEKFQRQFCAVFVELTREWAGGMSFATLMQTHTSFYEGSIIRTMKRLGELLNQVANAAPVAGNVALRDKIQEAAKLIERGIVFTASLYL